MAKTLINIRNIKKSFSNPEGHDLLVLENVNLTIEEGEIVALLGKSGSGKSTLLRIVAGLVPPTSGEVIYRDKIVQAPVAGISMVFQNFALMPWLTVLENVELGLEAMGLPQKERRSRALHVIDIIGMDGFENAYPKELSGGMRQRVGFARALVVNPDLLLMDEPFSALDVLTAENLRNDLMEIWDDAETYLKGMLFVTHNIEEAIDVADRVLVFDNNPGSIKGEIHVDLPHPRQSQGQAFQDLVDEVYKMMTSIEAEKTKARAMRRKSIGLDYRLPDARIAELIGLLEQLNEIQQKGPIDLPDVADEARLDVDDLFPILDALSVLQLAKVSEGDVTITDKGKEIVNADITEKKILFAALLLKHIPLARHIVSTLEKRPGGRATETRFLRELEDYFTEQEAERVLTTLIDWARYAEVLAFDYNTGILSLEDVK